jgi:hypothetical protein
MPALTQSLLIKEVDRTAASKSFNHRKPAQAAPITAIFMERRILLGRVKMKSRTDIFIFF